jgi:hypothetical protein
MKTDSGGFARILPFFSESAATFRHSGSAWNSAQFFLAASRLGCTIMYISVVFCNAGSWGIQ